MINVTHKARRSRSSILSTFLILSISLFNITHVQLKNQGRVRQVLGQGRQADNYELRRQRLDLCYDELSMALFAVIYVRFGKVIFSK